MAGSCASPAPRAAPRDPCPRPPRTPPGPGDRGRGRWLSERGCRQRPRRPPRHEAPRRRATGAARERRGGRLPRRCHAARSRGRRGAALPARGRRPDGSGGERVHVRLANSACLRHPAVYGPGQRDGHICRGGSRRGRELVSERVACRELWWTSPWPASPWRSTRPDGFGFRAPPAARSSWPRMGRAAPRASRSPAEMSDSTAVTHANDAWTRFAGSRRCSSRVPTGTRFVPAPRPARCQAPSRTRSVESII